MSVNLCIDWGNSRVKAAMFNAGDDKIIEMRAYTEDEAGDGLESFIDEFLPTKCIVCSVTSESFNIEQKLRQRVESLVKLDNNTLLPIMNAYSSPGTLGADRLALAVAAYTHQPTKNSLVISIGSCI